MWDQQSELRVQFTHGHNVLDDTGGLWCFCVAADGPRTDLIGPTCEVADELRERSVKLYMEADKERKRRTSRLL